jgi:hypothetical protein
MLRGLLLLLASCWLAVAAATNECNPTKQCNVCDSCCKSFIADGGSARLLTRVRVQKQLTRPSRRRCALRRLREAGLQYDET